MGYGYTEEYHPFDFVEVVLWLLATMFSLQQKLQLGFPATNSFSMLYLRVIRADSIHNMERYGQSCQFGFLSVSNVPSLIFSSS